MGVLAGLGGVGLWAFFHAASGPFVADSVKTGALTNAAPRPIDAFPQIAISGKKKSAAPQESAEAVPALFADVTEEAILAMARNRIALSVDGALAWAQAQADPGDRLRVLFAVVRAWGERDPVASVRWALNRPEVRTENLMEAALLGAARMPELAMAVGRTILAANSEFGAAYGMTLVGALTSAGEFPAAFQFANTGPQELRGDWLAAAFHRWGAQQPAEAINALNAIPDDVARGAAFRALAAGWAESDPAALTVYVYSLSPFTDREHLLGEALSQWATHDPRSLAIWLNTLSPGPEFDAGAAVLLAHSDQANRSTDVGLRWVESIANSELRRDGLRTVLAEWQQSQPGAAREYLSRVNWLNAEERLQILQSLNAALRGDSETGT